MTANRTVDAPFMSFRCKMYVGKGKGIDGSGYDEEITLDVGGGYRKPKNTSERIKVAVGHDSAVRILGPCISSFQLTESIGPGAWKATLTLTPDMKTFNDIIDLGYFAANSVVVATFGYLGQGLQRSIPFAVTGRPTPSIGEQYSVTIPLVSTFSVTGESTVVNSLFVGAEQNALSSLGSHNIKPTDTIADMINKVMLVDHANIRYDGDRHGKDFLKSQVGEIFSTKIQAAKAALEKKKDTSFVEFFDILVDDGFCLSSGALNPFVFLSNQLARLKVTGSWGANSNNDGSPNSDELIFVVRDMEDFGSSDVPDVPPFTFVWFGSGMNRTSIPKIFPIESFSPNEAVFGFDSALEGSQVTAISQDVSDDGEMVSFTATLTLPGKDGDAKAGVAEIPASQRITKFYPSSGCSSERYGTLIQRLSSLGAATNSAKITSIGYPFLTPNAYIKVIGLAQRYCGIYKITSAVHTIDGSGYKTELSLIMNRNFKGGDVAVVTAGGGK